MPVLDPATRQALAARMRFYRDLGLTEFYRRPVDPATLVAAQQSTAPHLEESSLLIAPVESQPSPAAIQNVSASVPTVLESAPVSKPLSAPSFPQERVGYNEPQPAPQPADRESALRIIREEIGDCTRCALHKGRNKLVFADGSPYARLLFVGEGPGADEDAQGLPFVGKAGQLLNNMIGAMGLKREEVYIANIVKCRPPGNRTPEPEEANTCSPFLFQQIDVVQPEVIVALGSTAATYLLGQRQPLAAWRGRIHGFRNSKLIVTYHPAFLLRDPRMKKEAWSDLQIAMRELGLRPKGKE